LCVLINLIILQEGINNPPQAQAPKARCDTLPTSALITNALSTKEDLNVAYIAVQLRRKRAMPPHITEYNGVEALKHVPAEHLDKLKAAFEARTAAVRASQTASSLKKSAAQARKTESKKAGKEQTSSTVKNKKRKKEEKEKAVLKRIKISLEKKIVLESEVAVIVDKRLMFAEGFRRGSAKASNKARES